MYKLLLDDERTVLQVAHLYDNNHPSYHEEGWKIARNFAEFEKIINEFGLPELVSFDHDLGEHRRGTHCARFLITYCKRRNFLPLPSYRIHSQNPIGAKEILSLLTSYEKYVIMMQSKS